MLDAQNCTLEAMADAAAPQEKGSTGRPGGQEGQLPLFKSIPFIKAEPEVPGKVSFAASFPWADQNMKIDEQSPTGLRAQDLIRSARLAFKLEPSCVCSAAAPGSWGAGAEAADAAAAPGQWLRSSCPSQGLACLAEAAEHLSIMDWPRAPAAGRPGNRSHKRTPGERAASLPASMLLSDWEEDEDSGDSAGAVTVPKRKRQSPGSPAMAAGREPSAGPAAGAGGADWVIPAAPGSGTKLCCGCSQVKAKSEFCRNRHRKDGLGTWCRACNIAAQKRRRARHQAVLLPTVLSKGCNKCGRVKASSDFGRDIYSRDGLNSRCKACRSLEWHRAGSRQQQQHQPLVAALPAPAQALPVQGLPVVPVGPQAQVLPLPQLMQFHQVLLQGQAQGQVHPVVHVEVPLAGAELVGQVPPIVS